jgi:hypothetical protein
MLLHTNLKQMAWVTVLASCLTIPDVLASGKHPPAVGEETTQETAEIAEPSVKHLALKEESVTSSPSPLASLFSLGAHREIYKLIAGYLDSKCLLQLHGVNKAFRDKVLFVLGPNATAEEIEQAKMAAFVAIICHDRSTATDVPETLNATFSWPNLVVLHGGIKASDFETLSTGLNMLSLKPQNIWSDEDMTSLQRWLGQTTQLESLRLPYCLIQPTVFGVSQNVVEPRPLEAGVFVSRLPLTLRHLDLSGGSHMGGAEIVGSLLDALSKSPIPLTFLSIAGRHAMRSDFFPPTLTSLSMELPFYCYWDRHTILPLPLPLGLTQLRFLLHTRNNVENVLKHIPTYNVIEELNIPLSYGEDVPYLLSALQNRSSLSQVKFLTFGFNVLTDKEIAKALPTLQETQLTSLDLRQCLSLSRTYKQELHAAQFRNRNGEAITIKL